MTDDYYQPVNTTNPQPRYTSNYPPLPPNPLQPPVPQPPQLPDYKPRGMSGVDKAFVWIFASVILVFTLTFAGKFLNAHIQPASPAKAKVTVTAPVTPKAATKKDK